MNKLKQLINSDFQRTYGYQKSKSFFSFVKEKLLYPEFNTLINYRKASYYTNSNNWILKLLWKLKWNGIRKKTGFQISLKTKIGNGLHLFHFGRIIVVSGAVLGKNCDLCTGVVIGNIFDGKKKGAPTLGDQVFVGANAVIVGGITIGSDVVIAPNSFVNFDVPDNSIVIGNPGQIIHKDHPTYNHCFNLCKD